MWSEIVQTSQFFLDNSNFLCEATSFIMTGSHLAYLTALLNSKLVTFIFKAFYAGGGLGSSGIRYKKAFMQNIPIPTPSLALEENITNLVLEVQSNPVELEKEIDKSLNQIVYKLYNLTEKEISFIEEN